MGVEPRPRSTVLIVDDDEAVRTLIAEVLGRAGYETVQAATGERALDLARERRPGAVVLDILLPGISGYEVCRELRNEFGRALPIIFLSGERVESFDRVAGLLLGADDYLVKPFAPDELVARVRSVLRPPLKELLARLTRREREVLRLLADGRTQKEIASDLVIAPKTVGTHIEHILDKLDVHSRAQAVALAYREELLGPEA